LVSHYGQIRLFDEGVRFQRTWQDGADYPLSGVEAAPHQVVLPPFAVQERAEMKKCRAGEFPSFF